MTMRSRPRGRYFLLGIVILAAGATHLIAQVNKASIVGTVIDTSGALVPDAEVTLVENATGTTQTTRTDQSGYYA